MKKVFTMKIIVSFKYPDAVQDAIECNEDVTAEDERKLKAIGEKYFMYGEYAQVEMDTRTMTATLKALPSANR